MTLFYGRIKVAEMRKKKKKKKIESEWHACGLFAILSLHYKTKKKKTKRTNYT